MRLINQTDRTVYFDVWCGMETNPGKLEPKETKDITPQAGYQVHCWTVGFFSGPEVKDDQTICKTPEVRSNATVSFDGRNLSVSAGGKLFS